MDNNQWQIMKESDDIKLGDEVIVDSDEGEEYMKFVKESNANNTITLKRKSGFFVFNQDTLEEMSDGEFSSSRYITGKGEV